MNRKFSIALAIVGIAVLGAAITDANAQCANAKDFKTAFGEGGDSFIVFPADADITIGGPNLKGRFWQAGARTLHNEGTTCPESSYFIPADVAPAGKLGIFGALNGDYWGTTCINLGCPTGSMILLVQTRSTDGLKSYFAVGKATETAGGFDFSTADPGADWTVLESPRPRVQTSGRNSGIVNVSLHFDAPSVHAHGTTPTDENSTITGYQIFRVTSNTDPGRAPGAWGPVVETLNTGAGGADTTMNVDCSGITTDVFIGTRVIFDNGQFLSDDISQATKIECDPNVAEPRFKQIEKKRPTSPRTPPSR